MQPLVARLRALAGRARRLAGRIVRRALPRPDEPALRYDDAATPEVAARVAELAERNRSSRAPVVDAASDLTVTMTTHGARLRDAWVALESIAAGDALPGRLVLALEPRDARRLPRRIRALRRRGLEVLVAPDGLGVHTKWFPVTEGLAGPLVTSDDDQLYPHDWLADLAAVHAEHPDDVVVHRAHVVGVVDGVVEPYLRWHPCMTTSPSPRHFGTSVSGQLLPAAVHRAARAEGTRFLDDAPTADDVWLHRSALVAGATIRQVRDAPANYAFVPGTQGSGLYQENVLSGRNDEQFAAVLTDATLARLRDDR